MPARPPSWRVTRDRFNRIGRELRAEAGIVDPPKAKRVKRPRSKPVVKFAADPAPAPWTPAHYPPPPPYIGPGGPVVVRDLKPGMVLESPGRGSIVKRVEVRKGKDWATITFHAPDDPHGECKLGWTASDTMEVQEGRP